MTTSIQTVTADAQVPDEEDADSRLLTHSYDGIREYDNPLPGWWKMIFAGSIAFAAAYGFYFHVANRGEFPDEAYRAQLADYEVKREVRMRSEAVDVSEAILAQTSDNPAAVERGAKLFQERCVSCHGNKAEGLIGPNLTDLNQLHGSTRMDLYTTISRGVSGTPMIAWSEQLLPGDVVSLAGYVTTLRGTNVPGKEPQGELVQKFAP